MVLLYVCCPDTQTICRGFRNSQKLGKIVKTRCPYAINLSHPRRMAVGRFFNYGIAHVYKVERNAAIAEVYLTIGTRGRRAVRNGWAYQGNTNKTPLKTIIIIPLWMYTHVPHSSRRFDITPLNWISLENRYRNVRVPCSRLKRISFKVPTGVFVLPKGRGKRREWLMATAPIYIY